MLKKVLASAFFALVFCGVSIIAQEYTSEKTLDSPKAKYDIFATQSNKVIVTQSHFVSDYPNSEFRVVALVSWELGKGERIYAVSINGENIDFEQSEFLQMRLDELLQTIKSFDNLKISSVGYRLPTGLSVSYYSYKDSSGKEQRNLYIATKMGALQSNKSIESLENLRNLIAQARAKIISLQTK